MDDLLDDLNKLYKELHEQLTKNDSFEESQLNQFNSNMEIYADNIVYYYEQIADRKNKISALDSKKDKNQIKAYEDEIDDFVDKIETDAKSADSDISTMSKMLR